MTNIVTPNNMCNDQFFCHVSGVLYQFSKKNIVQNDFIHKEEEDNTRGFTYVM